MKVSLEETVRYHELSIEGYERVVEAIDPNTGLHALIALHDTTLGPALGGTRMYPYASRDEALTDVLRLAQGMTYKAAIAGVGLGGGKSVIIGDPKALKSVDLFHSFAAFVNVFDGKYICAEDMGTSTKDMDIIGQKTLYVTGSDAHGSGDPSPFTAWGVFCGIQAVAQKLWNSTSLEGKTIAIQGVGHVGKEVANYLFWAGAKLLIADIDTEKAKQIAKRYGAPTFTCDEILSVECDILAPCAIGGILNAKTIPHLRCQAVAGAANNQLLTPEDAHLLKKCGILYAPDFVINAGGLINVALEIDASGYNPHHSRQKAGKIFDSLMDIFHKADENKLSTDAMACQYAQEKIKYGIGKRTVGPLFKR